MRVRAKVKGQEAFPPAPHPPQDLGGGSGRGAWKSASRSSLRPPLRLLLTGPPQCGKTTVIRRVAELFPGRVAGFYTQEVRHGGVRVGFEIITLDGHRGWLARVDFPGPHRVGKYGVDLGGFETLALPAMEPAGGTDLVIIDEVGKMECLSPRFVAAMDRLWSRPVPLVGTVAVKGGGYIEEIKKKPGALLITVTPANREHLPQAILSLLAEGVSSP